MHASEGESSHAVMMRRRELALLPVLPLIMDPVHLLVEM
jgi:hypothetical protein